MKLSNAITRLGVGAGLTLAGMNAAVAQQWKAPEISADNLEQWLKFIRPGEGELAWQTIRWHRELEDAAAEARKLQRPILLWTMNGHPCGET